MKMSKQRHIFNDQASKAKNSAIFEFFPLDNLISMYFISSNFQNSSKTGQLFVFLAVIFISLGGIALKYFVTQYETAQIRAHEQLSKYFM